MKSILQAHFVDRSYENNTWVAKPAYGTKFEDILETEYWANVSNQCRPGDIIIVKPEDMAYFAELIVVNTAREDAKSWIKVMTLRHIPLDNAALATEFDDADTYPKWGGPVDRWRVMQRSTNKILASKLSKDEAIKWIKDYNAIHDKAA